MAPIRAGNPVDDPEIDSQTFHRFVGVPDFVVYDLVCARHQMSLPAHAGMTRKINLKIEEVSDVPRTRRDDPRLCRRSLVSVVPQFRDR